MLLLAAFCVQRDQVDIHIRLGNPLDAQVQVTRDLIGGFDVAFHQNARDGQLLPAQIVGGDIRQQLRRIDGATHFH
ncbi:hypothetical protein D3C72_1556180 [compost metagenome]